MNPKDTIIVDSGRDDLSGAYLEQRAKVPNADALTIMATMQPENNPYQQPYRIDQGASPEQRVDKAQKLDAKAAFVDSMKRRGFSDAEIEKEITGGDTDPWFSPVDVAIPSGYMGYFISKIAGMGVAKSIGRAAASAILATVADAPVGMATETIAGEYPKLAVPFNLLFGLASGMTAERAVESAIINAVRKAGRKVPSLSSVKSLAKDFVENAKSGKVDEWINDGLFRTNMEMAPSKEAGHDALIKPITVWHGSKNPMLEGFDPSLEGTGIVSQGQKYGGTFFTSSKENAGFFADYKDLPKKISVDDLNVYGDAKGGYYYFVDQEGNSVINHGPFKTEFAAETAGGKAVTKYNEKMARGDDMFVTPWELKPVNPMEATAEDVMAAGSMTKLANKAKEAGHDALIVRDYQDGSHVSDIYVAFDKNIIKSPSPLPTAGPAPTSGGKQPWEMTAAEFDNNYAFHATKESNLPSIIENGVTKGSWAVGNVKGFPGDKLLIVPQSELTARGATPSKFGAWNLLEPEGTRARKYTNPIPADKITIIDKTDNPHEALIRQALSEGKPVPPEVLKDYPALVAKAGEERGSISIKPSDLTGEVAAEVHQKLQTEISDRITKALNLSNAPLVEIRPKAKDIDAATQEAADTFMRADRQNLELPDKAININLSKIESPEDIKSVMDNIATEYESGIQGARRGTIKNEEVQRLADDLGMNVDILLSRKTGEAFNAETALAARKINLASAMRLRELAIQAADPLAAEEVKFAFRKHLNLHYAIQAQVSGMTAEAGRALNQFKIKVDSTENVVLQVKDAMSRVAASGAEADDISRVAAAIITIDDPGKLTKYVRGAQNPGAMGMLRELWINSILSGPITHTKNILSNTLVAITQPAERGMASAIGHGIEAFGGGKAEIGAGEVVGQIMGMKMAFSDAFRLMGEIARIGQQQGGASMLKMLSDSFADQSGKIEYKAAITGANVMETPLGKMADKIGAGGMLARGTDLLGQVVRLPGTALGMEDVLFKGVGYRMELWAQAYRRASSEGLQGGALASRIQQIVDEPPADIHHLATQNADYQTFTKQLGDSGQALQRWISKTPGAFFVLPFVKTPVNIFKYFGERTPLALFSKAIRDDISAGGATRDLALARISLGSMVMATAGWWAMEGFITGAGPKNPDAQATWRRTGWQPYSIKVGDQYLSYGGMEPIGTTIGIAADIGEAVREYQEGHFRGDEEEEQIEKAVYTGLAALMKNAGSKTFLQGVTQFATAYYDPDRFLAGYAKSMAKSFIPNVVQQINRTEIDPVVRDARNIVDALKSAIPGLSDTLPPKRNLWGEPIVREGGGTPGLPDMLDPIFKSTDKKSGIDDEMKSLNMKIGLADRYIDGVELHPEEYDRYIQLIGNELKYNGKGLKDTLTDLIADPRYEQMSEGIDGGKVKMIKEIHANFKEAARAKLLQEFPDLYGAIKEHKQEKARKLQQKQGAPVF